MNHAFDAARRSRVVIASIAAAALSVAAFALVGVALLLGWIERPAPGKGPAMSAASPAPEQVQRPRIADGVLLLPGETLVEPPEANVALRAEPLMPRYSTPTPPPPAPRETPRLIEKPLPEAPQDAPPPRYPRRTHPTSPFDRWPQPELCEACGTVTSVRRYRDLAEVRVRFDDGDLRVIRYPPPAPWRAGDRVRLEDGRLLRDPAG